MKEEFSRWDPVEYLTTEADQVAYLRASLDEDPGDGSLIRAAIEDVARGHRISGMERISVAERPKRS